MICVVVSYYYFMGLNVVERCTNTAAYPEWNTRLKENSSMRN